MSERRVTWNALANFAQVRREASRTARSLENLEDRTNRLGDSSEVAAERVVKSHQRTRRSRREEARAAQIETEAVSDVTEAVDEERKGWNLRLFQSPRITRARREETRAAERQTVSIQDLFEAQQDETKAAQDRLRLSSRAQRMRTDEARATESQARATTDLADAVEDETRNTQQHTNVLSRLFSARRNLTSSTRDQEAATRALQAAQEAERQAVERLSNATLNLEQTKLRVARAEQQSLNANKNLSRAQADLAKATGDTAREQAALEQAQSRAAAKAIELSLAQGRLEQANRNVERSSRDVEAANQRVARSADDVTISAERGGRSLQVLTDRFRLATQAAGGFGMALGILKFTAIAAGIAHLIPLITQLVVGLYAVVAAISPLVTALAAVPSMLLGMGTAIGAAIAGFAGIGGALKAYGQQKAQTAATSKKADDGIARAARDSARVQRDAARATIDAARAVERAKEQQAEAAEAAARSVAQASERLADAQRDELRAQQDLNQARKDAIRYLDDMADRQRDASLSEEAAIIAVEEAKIRLEKTNFNRTSSELDRRKADLDYRMALARLDDAREAKKQAIEENAEAVKKGVEGSDIMVRAQERVVEASERTADAQVALADAQRAAAKSARDSARAVADALENQQRTAENNADAIIRAQERTASSFEAAAGPVDKFAEAMAKLSPAGQSFVRYLISLKPLLDNLRKQAQTAFLPGIESGLRTLTATVAPLLNETLVNTAKILGDGFANFAKVVGGNESTNILSRVFESNEKALTNLTAAAGPFYMALVRIMDAARPLVEWFSELTLQFANWADEATAVNTANGDMATAFDHIRETLEIVGSVIGNFFGLLYNIGKAGRDSGLLVLGVFDEWLGAWRDWSKTVEGQNSMREYFEAITPAFLSLASLLGRIGRLFLDLGVNPQTKAILDILAGPGMDAVERIIRVLTESEIGSGLANALVSIAEAVATLLENGGGGALEAFVNTIAKIFGWLAKIAEIGPMGSILGGIAVGVASLKAVAGVGRLTGVTAAGRAAGGFLFGQKPASVADGGNMAPSRWDRFRGRGGGPSGGGAATPPSGGGGGGGFFASGGGSQPPTTRRRRFFAPGGGGAGGGSGRHAAGGGPAFFGGGGYTGRRRATPSGGGAGGGSGRHAAGGGPAFFGGGGRTGRRRAAAVARGREAMQARAAAAPRRGGERAGGGSARTSATPKRAAAPAPRRGGERGAMSGKMAGGAGLGMAAGLAAMVLPTDNWGKFGDILQKILLGLAIFLPLLPVLGGLFAALISPIGLVVAAIAGLVVGIVLLWKKNEAFRNFIKGAWDGIREAVVGAWQNHIWPALKAFGSWISDNVVPVFKMLWDVAKVVWAAIANAVSWAWNNVIQPALDAFNKFVSEKVVPVLSWFWENAKAIFGFIGAAIQWWWNNVTLPILRAVVGFITDKVVPIFKWLWTNISAVFGFIGALIKWWWTNVTLPVLAAVIGFIRDKVGPVFTWLWNNIIKPVWDGIGTTIRNVWNNGIKPILTAFSDFISKTVAPKFSAGVRAITGAWDTVKKALAAPINWVIREVINKGIIDTFNTISKKIGGPTMDRAKEIGVPAASKGGGGGGRGYTAYAEGGPVRGRVRGQSLHRRQDNINAKLTAGEWVHPVDSARYYGPRIMEAIRRRMIPREIFQAYADGGEAEAAPQMNLKAEGGPSPWDTVKNIWNTGVDILRDPLGAATKLLEKPVNALLDRIPGAPWMVSWVKQVPKTLLSNAMNKIKSIWQTGDESGIGRGAGAMPWGQIWAMIKSVAPEARMTSNFRRGAITASGFTSLHGLGRAVDLVSPNMMATFNKIRPLRSWTELYHSPAEYRQVLRGKPHRPSGVTRANHFDHIHAAMAAGGPAGGGQSPKLGMPRYASGGPVMSPSVGFASSSFRGTRLTGRANAATRGNAAFGLVHRDGDVNTTNVITNVYNPLPERPSESVQRRLSRTAQLGLIGGRRSDTDG